MHYFKICFLTLFLLPWHCCKKKKSSLVRISEQRPTPQNTSVQPSNIQDPSSQNSTQTASQSFTCEDEGFDKTGFYVLKNGQKNYPEYKHTPKTKEDLITLLDAQTSLKEINIYHIIDMSNLFRNRNSYNFEGIEDWSVCRVTNMSGMFSFCDFFNRDLSKWKVNNVLNMNQMFYGCTNFNQDLSKWRVDNVTTMNQMFFHCNNFNQDLSKWKVDNVGDMNEMFENCYLFDQDLSSWKINKVIDIEDIFENTSMKDKTKQYPKKNP